MEEFLNKQVQFTFLKERLVGKCIEIRTINDKQKAICKSGKFKFPADEHSIKII